MKKPLVFIALVVFLLSACGTRDSDRSNRSQGDEVPSMLNVELTINPEQAKQNELVTFTATVTQDDKPVEDATTVKYEIWKDGDEKHEFKEVTHDKNGQYKVEMAFSEPGTYYAISHVTARNIHTMPKKEFKVIGSE